MRRRLAVWLSRDIGCLVMCGEETGRTKASLGASDEGRARELRQGLKMERGEGGRQRAQ